MFGSVLLFFSCFSNKLYSESIFSPKYAKNALPETLPNGMSFCNYDINTDNKPSEYGSILYLAISNNSNKWYTAIASSTYKGGIYVSSKTNNGSWSEWTKISNN